MIRIAAMLLLDALCAAGFGQDSLAKLEEQAFKAAAAKVAPCVVQIQTFGGLERVGETLTGTGPTSGVIVSEDGFIVSSAFSFAAKPAAVIVKLPEGGQVDAKVIGTDFSRMLTLLKVDAAGLPVPETAPADEARVGQWALALGKAFDVATPNFSPGVVSATNRIWGKAIQTDAKTSPFNYGGALIDIQGRVLGVIVPLSMTSDEVMAGAEWYDSGIGFAIPMDQVATSVERLKSGGDQHRGTLGIVAVQPGNLFAEPAVEEVRKDAAAADAGILAGDVIVAIDGTRVSRQSQVMQALGTKYAGDQVEVTVKRGDEEQTLTVTLEKPSRTSIVPEQTPTQQPGEDGPDRDEGQPRSEGRVGS